MNKVTGGNHKNGLFLVVSAPSGTGKTSICRALMKRQPDLRFSISHTTRPPRPGEVDGRDYRFIAGEAFRKGIDAGDYIEWAENYGYLYGTPVETMTTFLEQGFDLLLDVEPKGAKALKDRFSNGIYIFILPPSIEELRRRISRRGAESGDVLEKRIVTAVSEISEALWYNYVIFNDRLDDAIERLQAIYLAEKSKTERVSSMIHQLFPKDI